jgi:hypothetical protein
VEESQLVRVGSGAIKSTKDLQYSECGLVQQATMQQMLQAQKIEMKHALFAMLDISVKVETGLKHYVNQVTIAHKAQEEQLNTHVQLEHTSHYMEPLALRVASTV